MTAEWTFEHTTSGLLLLCALIGSLAFVVFVAARWLPRNLRGLGILGLRIAFLLLLFWVMLLPGLRRSAVDIIRPRLPVLLDTSASMTQDLDEQPGSSRWQKALSFLEDNWVRSLRARVQIELYPFDSELAPARPISMGKDLEPKGKATHLNLALTHLFERLRGQDVLGVVVLSDGNDTREKRDNWATTHWPAPLYVAALENPGVVEQLPDVRIDSLETSRRAVINWDTTLSLTIAGHGVRGDSFPVELHRDGQLVERVSAQLPPEGGSRDMQFILSHPVVGTEIWSARIPPLPREIQTNDNEMVVAVEVIDSQNRLLFLENTPRFESKHLVRELFDNDTITPMAFFRGPGGAFIAYGDQSTRMLEINAEQLSENSILILGNFAGEALDSAKCDAIIAFVEKGGSLILIGGDRFWSTEGVATTPLAKLLPFTRPPGPALEGRYPVSWTAEGRAHPAFVNSPDFPDELPPVLSVFANAAPGAATFTLAEAVTEGGPQPLALSRAYGQGKVLALMTDSLWRWNMQAAVEKPYALFWRQIIEWMSPSAEDTDKTTVELFTDTATVAVGESVSLQARIIEPRDSAPRKHSLKCDIESPSGRIITLDFTPRLVSAPGGREVQGFAAQLQPDEDGNWKAIAKVELDSQVISSAPCFFSARSVSQEIEEKPANVRLLGYIAGSSAGRYAEPDQLATILRSLQVEERRERRLDYATLWQNRWILVCLITLLALEWMLRKTGGMK